MCRNLDRDIESSSKRWKKFVESECPEREKFPQEWKNKTSLQRLMMMRALRPDRMTYAVVWVEVSWLNFAEKVSTLRRDKRGFAQFSNDSGNLTKICVRTKMPLQNCENFIRNVREKNGVEFNIFQKFLQSNFSHIFSRNRLLIFLMRI